MSGTRILFLEDDKLYQETIKDVLEEENFIIDTCSNGEKFLNKIYDNVYDLYILDINVPQIDGYEIMNILSEYEDETLRLVLTSIPNSTIISFKNGCDGYLNKTGNNKELILRIKSLIKRSYKTYHQDIIINKNLSYNIFSKKLFYNQEPLEVESQALLVLNYLIKKRGEFVSKEILEKNVYPSNSNSKSDVIRYHIWHLRKILGVDIIESQKNRGYKLKPIGV